MTTTDNNISSPTAARAVPRTTDAEHRLALQRALDRRSFAVISTVSAAGFPHAAGVMYDNAGFRLYVNTHRTSRKARNVAATGRAGIVVPVRRLPVGPPFAVQFQATARLVEMDDPQIRALIADGRLSTTTSHGELDDPDGTFIELVPTGRLHSYGIGFSIVAVARDPLHVGARSIDLA